jgi:hypothetical protein
MQKPSGSGEDLSKKWFAYQSLRSVVPKVGCTAPWEAVGLPRGALEAGPSERVVRLFTIDQARA